MKNTAAVIIGFIIIGLVGAVIGFGLSRRLAFARQGFMGNRTWEYRNVPKNIMPDRAAKGRAGRGLIQGQITKIDSNNVTLQLPTGGTYTVTIGEQTVVNKTVKGVKSDLKEGQNITVFGVSFMNGAQTVIINP